MGTNLSPSIATTGLILVADPQNVKSFRGEPTVNRLVNSLPTAGWTTANYLESTCTTSFVTEDGEPAMKLTNVIYGSGPAAGYPRITADAYFSSNTTVSAAVSVSYEVKGTPGATMEFKLYSAGSTKIQLSSPVITGEWQKVTHENQSAAFSLDRAYVVPLTTGATYFIRKMQVEQKAYATPYVNGTRDGYVANNGGVYDLSGKNNHLALVGNTISNTVNGIAAFSFDGVGDHLLPVSNTLIGDNTLSQQLTIDFWVNFDLTTPPADGFYTRGIMGYYAAGSTLINYKLSGNAVFTDVIDTSAIRTITYNTAALTARANTWVHIATTFDTGNLITYSDGIQYSTATIANPVAYAANSFTIGAGGGYYDYFGKLGVIKVYNRVLSPAEIKQNYDAMRRRYNV